MIKQQNKSFGNPYLDGLEAKERANQTVTILNESFGKIEQMGAKQLYFIKNRGKSFYVLITSAPSNTKIIEAIKGASKRFGKFPFYVIFTRDANDYPDGSVKGYWNKLKGLNKHLGRKFLGAIISVNDLISFIPNMKKLNRISNDINYFSNKSGNRLEVDFLLKEKLKEKAKLSPKQIQQTLEIFKTIK